MLTKKIRHGIAGAIGSGMAASGNRVIAGLTAAFTAAIAESETRTARAIERSETSLLTAFHQWASPLEARVRSDSLERAS
jgi:hypothetical protein